MDFWHGRQKTARLSKNWKLSRQPIKARHKLAEEDEMQMPTISLKAHFDGQTILLDEPAELPFDAQLLVTVLSPVPSKAAAEPEPLSASRREEIEAWIQNAETLVADVDADDGPSLQSAVTEVRRQARRSVEASP